MLPATALVLGTLLAPAGDDGHAGQPRSGHGLAALVARPLAPVDDERAAHLGPPGREKTKKEIWLDEKRGRPDVHTGDEQLRPVRPARATRKPAALKPTDEAAAVLAGTRPRVGTRIEPLVTLHNRWTREFLPLLPGLSTLAQFRVFLRDHFTNEATEVDPVLRQVLAAAALRFRAQRIDVISGYRSPKYNLMLRKKGRQVARESQHLLGKAVDFRVRGVPTETLVDFLRGLRVGGVGFYSHSRFVHSDTGRVRFWKGS
jgi:uncharacterized protein YcbK (DUF882 family)